ncbi:VTC domain-containing protein [Alphaproteobacteria bacterium]|nr:VTC domain-containing protein [Alphaproteobacteria bacterium]
MKLFDSDYGALKSKIIINYQRDYYILKRMRITFDKNINYHNVNSIVKNRHRDNECVMEIKVEQNCNDDYIKKYIDISISRFSKYARGILLLNLIK